LRREFEVDSNLALEISRSRTLEEGPLSTLAMIVAVALVVPLLGTLVVAARKAARPRALEDLGPADDDGGSYRSHAEASRRTEAERL